MLYYLDFAYYITGAGYAYLSGAPGFTRTLPECVVIFSASEIKINFWLITVIYN
jgi:hypothetical protein